jgi:hypothetical protein
LWEVFRRGDILLADRLTSNGTGIVLLKQRGVDTVSRLNKATRRADFRRGKRLGPGDHLVRWRKPTSIRSISFKGSIRTLEAFQPVIALLGARNAAFRLRLYQQLLDAVAAHRVADRPDRFEPRRLKRRPKRYDRLMKSRQEAKRDILNGVSQN